MVGGGPPSLFATGFNVGGPSRLTAPLAAAAGGAGGVLSSNAAGLAGVPLGMAPGGGRGDLLAAIAMGLPGLQAREADRWDEIE